MENKAATFPRGVEITCAPIVQEGSEILLLRSPKQGDKFILPGGHIEPGESILEASTREVFEETGLVVLPIAIVRFNEMINPPDFHRAIHLIYFNTHVVSQNRQVKLDQIEVTEAIWLTPEQARTADLAAGYASDIEAFIEYQKQPQSGVGMY